MLLHGICCHKGGEFHKFRSFWNVHSKIQLTYAFNFEQVTLLYQSCTLRNCRDKNRLRTFQHKNRQKLKNSQPRPKFTGYYKKECQNIFCSFCNLMPESSTTVSLYKVVSKVYLKNLIFSENFNTFLSIWARNTIQILLGRS